MLRSFLNNRAVIAVIIGLQIVPLLLFPPSAYSLSTQEWWLPVLLSFFVVIALVQLLVRRSQAAWPWYLLNFSQGLNIISRLMMVLPHVTIYAAGVPRFNTSYVILAVVAMLLSVFEIWYCDKPEIHNRLLA
jgi:hypothetical protein